MKIDREIVCIGIVRDLYVVPDDPDRVYFAVALLPRRLVSIWVWIAYPPYFPANDAIATGIKMNDVNILSKDIDPRKGIRSCFCEHGSSLVKKARS